MKRSPMFGRQSPMARSTALTRTVFRRKRARVTPEETVARQLVAARSMGLCEIDQRHPATDMHHLKNRSQGGTWAVENLLHICRQHHSQITTNPEWARRYGWSRRRGADPAASPVFVHGGWVLLESTGRYLPSPLPTSERTA